HRHAVFSFIFPSPLDFVTIVDERTQNQRDIAICKLFLGNSNFVSCFFKNCSQIANMNARNILKESSDPLHPACGPRESLKPRSITTNNRILVYKTDAAFQIRDDNAHKEASG